MLIEKVHAFSKTIWAKIIIGLIVFSFTFVGVNGLLLPSGSDKPTTIVRVGEAIINERDFSNLFVAELNSRLTEDGASPSVEIQREATRSAIAIAIKRATLLDQAMNDGFVVDGDVIDDRLIGDSALQDEDGVFSAERLQNLLVENAISEKELITNITNDILIDWLSTSIVNSAVGSKEVVSSYYTALNEQRSGFYIALDISEIASNISPSEEAIEEYYKNNNKNLRTEAKIRVNYLLLNAHEMPIIDESIVSEENLRQAYDASKANAEEDKIILLRHILLAEDNDNQERIAEIKQALKQKTFAEVAKEFSDDPVSAENGGLLDEIELSSLPDSFRKVLPELKAGETYPEPLQSDFGVHFIMLEKIENAPMSSFATEKPRLKQNIILRAKRQELAKRYTTLEEQAYLAQNLADLVSVAGTSERTSDWLYQDTNKNEESFARIQTVITKVFSQEFITSEQPSLVQLDEDTLLVMQKNEFEPSKIALLEEVRDIVHRLVQKQQASSMAQKVISKATQTANNKYASDNLTTDEQKQLVQQIQADLPNNKLKIKWEPFIKMTRYNEDLPSKLTRVIFNGKQSNFLAKKYLLSHSKVNNNVNNNDDTYYLVYVNSVESPDISKTPKQSRDLWSNYYTRNIGQEILTLWLNHKAQTTNKFINQQSFK